MKQFRLTPPTHQLALIKRMIENSRIVAIRLGWSMLTRPREFVQISNSFVTSHVSILTRAKFDTPTSPPHTGAFPERICQERTPASPLRRLQSCSCQERTFVVGLRRYLEAHGAKASVVVLGSLVELFDVRGGLATRILCRRYNTNDSNERRC